MKKQYQDSGYFVDTSGNVYGLRVHKLKPKINKHGYEEVVINRKGKLVHRLVAICFIPNPENHPCVNHKDGNKLNNKVENLEWCTYKENSIHAVDLLGLHSENHPRATITDEQVHQACKMMQDGYRNSDVAKKLNIPKVLVNNIRMGKNWLRISQEYVFPKIYQRGISDATFYWCCHMLEKKMSVREIIALCECKTLTKSIVEKIRSRDMRPELSTNFNF